MIKPVFTQDSPRIHAMFVSLLRFFSRLVPNKPVAFGLKASEQFLLVLVKLKQAVQNQDLADRFCIHITKVLKVLHLRKDVMFNVVTDLISFLDRGLIRKNLPECFKGKYSTLLASSTVQKCSLNDQFLVWLEVRLNVTIKAMIM